MRLAAIAIAVALVVAACGDSDGGAGTVVFGEGEIPDAVPSDFPVPADAVIGSTLVDTINTKSEFEFRTATDFELLVQLLSIQLVEAGYVVDTSTGDATSWMLEFRRGSLEGSVQVRPLGPGITQGAVTVNDA